MIRSHVPVTSVLFLTLATSCLAAPTPVPAGAEKNAGSVIILMYHKVVDSPTPSALRVPAKMFARQMEYLAREKYQVISLATAVRVFTGEKRPPSKAIVLTFDDGYEDNYKNAFPILKRLGFKATTFLIAQRVGKALRWKNEAGQPVARLMDWKEIREMARAGMEFGSHSLTHPDLSKSSLKETRRQVQESRTLLGRELQRPIVFFCYPYGRFTRETARIVKDAGYLAACSSMQGVNHPGCDLFALKRIRVNGRKSFEEFVRSLKETAGR